jgi:hypothetical protein
MRLFRRREPHHRRLAREGGLAFGENPGDTPPAGDPVLPAWDAAGIHGIQRVREWDAVVTVRAADLRGERAEFVALSDGTIVIEDGPDSLEPLADALEAELPPPYRAEAVRRDGSLWAVAGRSIELVELPGIAGEELELATRGSERTLLVDGESTFFGTIPALERPEHVVRARRVDGETWEVDAAPL